MKLNAITSLGRIVAAAVLAVIACGFANANTLVVICSTDNISPQPLAAHIPTVSSTINCPGALGLPPGAMVSDIKITISAATVAPSLVNFTASSSASAGTAQFSTQSSFNLDLSTPLPGFPFVADPMGNLIDASAATGAVAVTPGTTVTASLTGPTASAVSINTSNVSPYLAPFTIIVLDTHVFPTFTAGTGVTFSGSIFNSATATLQFDYVVPPAIGKSFSPSIIAVGGTSTLTFTIANPNVSQILTGVQFADLLPAGLVVTAPFGPTGSCPPGIITAFPGSHPIILGPPGATLAPQASCTFSIDVTSDGTVQGDVTNTTSTVTVASNPGLNGAPASASIFIYSPLDNFFQSRYVSNLGNADAEVIMTNTGASGAGAALAPNTFGTASNVTGAICVNVYTLDPGEELESCCSCPVTPDGLVSLFVKTNLLLNPLFPGPAPSSVVIKLYATVPAAGPTGCAGSAANTSAVPAPGLAAWGTTTHVIPGNFSGLPGAAVATETAFTPSTPNVSEILKLQNLCSIAQNGASSGAGICSGCGPI